MLKDVFSTVTRCRATLLPDAFGALSLVLLLIVALHLPEMF